MGYHNAIDSTSQVCILMYLKQTTYYKFIL